jgi:hypothetical protein
MSTAADDLLSPPEPDGKRTHTVPLDALAGGPTTSAWREEALTAADELGWFATWIEHDCRDEPDIHRRLGIVRKHIRTARLAAQGLSGAPLRDRMRLWRRFKSSWSGSGVERARGNLDAAEADLLRLAPAEYVCGAMPGLEAHVNRYLPKADPRRVRVEQLARTAETQPLTERERNTVVSAVHAANSQRRRNIIRVRSFRNILLSSAVLLLLVAIGLGVLGWRQPTLIPLCFNPSDQVVCPTDQIAVPNPTGGQTAVATAEVDNAMRDAASKWDIWLVELIGMVAAGVSAAFALRKIRGTTTPYSLPVALAALKLPTGALTAFLGILLMRGGFVPGLTALDTSAQILSWAIVFGYAQQLFTRFVDDQAHAVLDGVGGRGATGDRQPAGQPA